MSTITPHDDRLLELLADDAVGQLEEGDRAELDALLGGERDESMELAAAAATVAMLAPEVMAMPDSLRARLEVEARRSAWAVSPPPAPLRLGDDGPEMATRGWAWLGWVAAAACLAVAVAAWWPEAPLAPDAAMDRFLATHPDAARGELTDWALDGEGPEIPGVTGEVVWSEEDQTGYLRLVGLPANDPTREQYQLWIVDERGLADKETGQSNRISGAIFDAETGETIVPIDPAIPVRNAGAFAVTIEAPGGVWASDMTRRVVIASVGG
jgi:hypothetical protein